MVENLLVEYIFPEDEAENNTRLDLQVIKNMYGKGQTFRPVKIHGMIGYHDFT